VRRFFKPKYPNAFAGKFLDDFYIFDTEQSYGGWLKLESLTGELVDVYGYAEIIRFLEEFEPSEYQRVLFG